MKIKSLRMQNFRGFEDETIEFNDRVTVLIGDNGAGKSSVLDCLGYLLREIIARVDRKLHKKLPFHRKNISLHKRHTQIEITFNNKMIDYTINLMYNIPTHEKQVAFPEENKFKNALTSKDNLNKHFSLPLILLVPISRYVNTRFKNDVQKVYKISDVYERCLSPNRDYGAFLSWYFNRDFNEHERKIQLRLAIDSDKLDRFMTYFGEDNLKSKDLDLSNKDIDQIKEYISFRDVKLDIVRKKLRSSLQDMIKIRDLQIDIRMNEIGMRKHGLGKLFLSQFSEGEKLLIALFGDIIRRLAIANPGLDDPLQGEGVVMIDEIELHLHPKWQRMIIPKLTETFPNLQFIVTTHSPQVLGEVKDGTVYHLTQQENTIKAVELQRSYYGWDSNRILNRMGANVRNKEVSDKLDELYDLIDDDKWEEAESKRNELKEILGSDEPELVVADTMLD